MNLPPECPRPAQVFYPYWSWVPALLAMFMVGAKLMLVAAQLNLQVRPRSAAATTLPPSTLMHACMHAATQLVAHPVVAPHVRVTCPGAGGGCVVQRRHVITNSSASARVPATNVSHKRMHASIATVGVQVVLKYGDHVLFGRDDGTADGAVRMLSIRPFGGPPAGAAAAPTALQAAHGMDAASQPPDEAEEEQAHGEQKHAVQAASAKGMQLYTDGGAGSEAGPPVLHAQAVASVLHGAQHSSTLAHLTHGAPASAVPGTVTAAPGAGAGPLAEGVEGELGAARAPAALDHHHHGVSLPPPSPASVSDHSHVRAVPDLERQLGHDDPAKVSGSAAGVGHGHVASTSEGGGVAAGRAGGPDFRQEHTAGTGQAASTGGATSIGALLSLRACQQVCCFHWLPALVLAAQRAA